MGILREFWEVSFGKKVEIKEEDLENLENRNKEFYELAKEKVIYGFNTGLGPMAEIRLSEEDLRDFQILTLRSHSTSTGKPLPIPLVRGAMYLRLKHLIKGGVGIRPLVLKRLEEFLNLGITPVVYAYGSVGASGDLSPLSHIALSMMGEGWVYLKNRNKVPSIVAHRMYNLEPISFEPREALALINGYSFSLSNLGLAIYEIRNLLEFSYKVFYLSWRAIGGRKAPFDPRAVKMMGDSYALKIAERIWKFVEKEEDGKRVQDPYSFRCFPQITSPLLRALEVSEGIFVELSSGCSDNPIFSDGEILSTGNFHGQSISFASDILAIGTTAFLGSIERRVFYILSDKSDLPYMLSENPGKDPGLMILQTALASIFAESKVLSTPYSYQSVPTGNDQEDWVPMSFGGTLRLLKLAEFMLMFLSAELLCVYKAFKLRGLRDETFDELEEYFPQYRKNLSLYEEWEIVQKFIEERVEGIIRL